MNLVKMLDVNDMWSEKMRKYAPVVVRIAVSLVFLWFASAQLRDPGAWTGLIPHSIVSLSGMSALSFVYSNAISEIVLGILLLSGFLTRIAAILLALKLFGIMFIIGYNDIGVRDFGLAMATLSTFFAGPDAWSLDNIFRK